MRRKNDVLFWSGLAAGTGLALGFLLAPTFTAARRRRLLEQLKAWSRRPFPFVGGGPKPVRRSATAQDATIDAANAGAPAPRPRLAAKRPSPGKTDQEPVIYVEDSRTMLDRVRSELGHKGEAIAVDLEHVNLNAVAQTVYVHGLVATEAERERLTQAIAAVEGVQRVDSQHLRVGAAA